MKKNIIFVTGNNGKIKTLREYLNPIGWNVEKLDLPLQEIQSFSLNDICTNKIKQIEDLKLIEQPFVLTDSGLFVDSLNGFPGAYTKPVVEKIGCNGILKLIENDKERNCYFEMCLIFVDENKKQHIFTNIVTGKISEVWKKYENSKAWGSVWDIFIPTGSDNRVIADMTTDEYNILKDKHQKGSAWKEFTAFLINNYK